MPTQDPLRLHNIPGDTISASPPGDRRNAPPSMRAPTPTTSFATEFPTPHEIYSTQTQQPTQPTHTVSNTNHNQTSLAQTLKASFNHTKQTPNRSTPTKPTFHNPSQLTEYLTDNSSFTGNLEYNFSFKLTCPSKDPIDFKNYSDKLYETLNADSTLQKILMNTEIMTSSLSPTTRYLHLHNVKDDMNSDVISRIEANVLQLEKVLPDYKIHLQPRETIQNGVILRFNFNSFIHNDNVPELISTLFTSYGNIIKTYIPPVTFVDEDIPKTAYVLMDLTAPVLPPRRQVITFSGKTVHISSYVNSPLLYCSYCRVKGHHIKNCPFKPGCKHCGQDHKLIQCNMAPVHTLRNALEKVPPEYLAHVACHTPPERILPKWFILYEKLFPSRANGYTKEIEMRINELKSHESVSDLPSMFKRPRVSLSQATTPTESDSLGTHISHTHQKITLATEDANETTSLTSETQPKQTPEVTGDTEKTTPDLLHYLSDDEMEVEMVTGNTF